MANKTLEAIERIAVAAEKMLLETERLRRDVRALNARIEPQSDIEPWPMDPPYPRKRRDVVDSLNMIDTARAHILSCEQELSIIRGRIDNIAADAISREEMKPFIKR